MTFGFSRRFCSFDLVVAVVVNLYSVRNEYVQVFSRLFLIKNLKKEKRKNEKNVKIL